jgi:hypothetical protein
LCCFSNTKNKAESSGRLAHEPGQGKPRALHSSA